MARASLFSLAILIAGCGGPARGLPDYAEYLRAGVVPEEEAERVVAYLARSELALVERIDVAPAIALSFHRQSDGARAVRVVTPSGVAFGLESSSTSAVADYRGDVTLDPSTGSDVDGDGRRDVVVARAEPHRRCLMVIAVSEDGALEVLAVDGADLDPTACLEAMRDVDGDGRSEAIVALYGEARGARAPRAELPLERDEAGVYRRAPPSVAFLAVEQARIDAALGRARAAADAEEALVLSVERAFLLFAAGRAIEEQVAAFDDAVAVTIWPEGFRPRIDEARGAITAGAY